MNRMMLRRRVLMASLMNSGLPLSDLPEGSLVAINERGSPVLFYLAKHDYESGLNGAGTIDDPIPAARGMDYTYGLYYLDTEDGKTYLCKRGEETGSIVLYYLPHELIGQYFEEVT